MVLTLSVAVVPCSHPLTFLSSHFLSVILVVIETILYTIIIIIYLLHTFETNYLEWAVVVVDMPLSNTHT